MDSKLNTVDEATSDDEQVVDPPRKAKKADKKKAVTGKALIAPPHWEHHGPRQTLSEALNAHDSSRSSSHLPREKTGLNASCSATTPRVAEKPRPIPVVWDDYEARHEEFAYDDPRPAQFSQDFNSHQGFDSFYGDRRYGLSCPTSASWYHLGINSVPCRTSSGRKLSDK
jgi:hypothetical protein